MSDSRPLLIRSQEAVAALRAEFGNTLPLKDLLEVCWIRGYSAGLDKGEEFLNLALQESKE